MNRLDPRFLKGLGNFVEGTITTSSMPSSPATGAKYLCLYESDTAHFNKIAQYNGSTWEYFTPEAGTIVADKSASPYAEYKFTGSAWEKELDSLYGIVMVDELAIDATNGSPNAFSVNSGYKIGNKQFLYDNGKIYTAIGVDSSNYLLWDDGQLPTTTVGESVLIYSADDKIIYKFTKNSGDTDTIEQSISNVADGTIIFVKGTGTFYEVTNTGIKVKAYGGSSSGGGSGVTTETHTLTSSEVSSKSFTLSNSVSVANASNAICFVNGLAQAAGTAFSISDTTFGWNEKTLDGVLQEGDVLIVQYNA